MNNKLKWKLQNRYLQSTLIDLDQSASSGCKSTAGLPFFQRRTGEPDSPCLRLVSSYKRHHTRAHLYLCYNVQGQTFSMSPHGPCFIQWFSLHLIHFLCCILCSKFEVYLYLHFNNHTHFFNFVYITNFYLSYYLCKWKHIYGNYKVV